MGCEGEFCDQGFQGLIHLELLPAVYFEHRHQLASAGRCKLNGADGFVPSARLKKRGSSKENLFYATFVNSYIVQVALFFLAN